MSHDTFLHRISRPVIVRPLLNTSVTPNQITHVRLLTGVAAAVVLGLGVSPYEHVAAGLFVLSVILDRADGDLARIKRITSPGGHRYDLICDALCNALIFVGLGVGLMRPVRGFDIGLYLLHFSRLSMMYGEPWSAVVATN